MFHNTVRPGQGGSAVHADHQQPQLTDCSLSAGMVDLFNSAAFHMLIHMPCRAGKDPRQTSCHSKQAQLRALQMQAHVQS